MALDPDEAKKATEVISDAEVKARKVIGHAEVDARDLIGHDQSDARDAVGVAAEKAHQVLLDSPTDPASDKAVETIRKLNNEFLPSLKEINKQLGQVKKLLRRRIYIGLVLLVVLGGMLWWVKSTADAANRIASKAETNQQAAYQTCLGTNVERVNNTILWTAAINSFVSSSNSPQATAVINNIRHLVAVTDSPRDCAKLKH